MRFYFTVKDGRTYPDKTGYIFTGPNEAIDYANTLAGELYKEPDLRDSFIIISDNQGSEIARVAITESAGACSGAGSEKQPVQGGSSKSFSDPE